MRRTASPHSPTGTGPTTRGSAESPPGSPQAVLKTPLERKDSRRSNCIEAARQEVAADVAELQRQLERKQRLLQQELVRAQMRAEEEMSKLMAEAEQKLAAHEEEEQRLAAEEKHYATALQSAARRLSAMRSLGLAIGAAVRLQKAARRRRAASEAEARRSSQKVIVAHASGALQRRRLQQQHAAATQVGKMGRAHSARRVLRRNRAAAVRLQGLTRGAAARAEARRRRAAVLRLQSLYRGHVARCRVRAHNELMAEAERMSQHVFEAEVLRKRPAWRDHWPSPVSLGAAVTEAPHRSLPTSPARRGSSSFSVESPPLTTSEAGGEIISPDAPPRTPPRSRPATSPVSPIISRSPRSPRHLPSSAAQVRRRSVDDVLLGRDAGDGVGRAGKTAAADAATAAGRERVDGPVRVATGPSPSSPSSPSSPEPWRERRGRFSGIQSPQRWK